MAALKVAALKVAALKVAALKVAERIRSAFAEPAHCHGHVLTVHASIGLAAGLVDDPAALVRDADAAMYAAKRQRESAAAAAA